ncbi:hypothetical protein DIPPA_18392 [Diplonema papillatum]|nr:hypothetical protein DIPPA_18392 [Diplonema papillatum]
MTSRNNHSMNPCFENLASVVQAPRAYSSNIYPFGSYAMKTYNATDALRKTSASEAAQRQHRPSVAGSAASSQPPLFHNRMSSGEFARIRKEQAAQQEAAAQQEVASKAASKKSSASSSSTSSSTKSSSKEGSRQKAQPASIPRTSSAGGDSARGKEVVAVTVPSLGIRVRSSEYLRMVPHDDGGSSRVEHMQGDEFIERSTQYPPAPSTPLEQPTDGDAFGLPSGRPLGRIRKVSASPSGALSEPRSVLSENSFAHSPGLGGRGGYRAESPDKRQADNDMSDRQSSIAADSRVGISTSPYRSRSSRQYGYGQYQRSPVHHDVATPGTSRTSPVPGTPLPQSPVFASEEAMLQGYTSTSTRDRVGSQDWYRSPTGAVGAFAHVSPVEAKSSPFADFLSGSSLPRSPYHAETRLYPDATTLASTGTAYKQVHERVPAYTGGEALVAATGPPHVASSVSPTHKDWQPSSFGKTICKCRCCLRVECEKLIGYTIESARLGYRPPMRKKLLV